MKSRAGPVPPRRGLVQLVLSSALVKVAWMVGAPMLMLAAGLMALCWNFLQQGHALDRLDTLASNRVQARLVDRYFLLRDAGRADVADCTGLCQVAIDSVAVFAFAADGVRVQVEFVDRDVHDWQHPTVFERHIPLLTPSFRLAPALQARLQQEPSRLHHDYPTQWAELWHRIDDPAHWLARIRPQPLEWDTWLRHDPHDPHTALLDAPPFVAQRLAAAGYLWQAALALFLVSAVFAVLLLVPGVRLMLHGVPRRWQNATIAAICLGVPLWAPHTQAIAPYLSQWAGDLARGMQREFGRDPSQPFVAVGVRDTGDLQQHVWTLTGSDKAAFFAGVPLQPAAVDPLDMAAAYDEVQAQLDAHWRRLGAGDLAAAVATLRHYQALEGAWELYLPALLRVAQDPDVAAATRADASMLLGHFASGLPMPTIDSFMYRHRLDNYARLLGLSDPAIAATARARLEQAERVIRAQQATLPPGG